MSLAPALRSGPVRWERTRLLLSTPTFMVGLAILLFWVGCATVGQTLVDPLADDMMNSLLPPSAEHWFGTDQLGRDMFARVIAGSRDILIVAPLATVLGIVCGTLLGLIMGFFPGLVDDLLSRLIEAVLALPLLILALVALTALGASNGTVIVAIGLAFTPQVARVVRSAVMSERHLDYVAAARLRGETAVYIMVVEILPNILPPITVELTVRLGYAIFTVATLSFLGVGLQPPSPDWGLAISENYALIGGGYWWTVLFDALAIGSLVVSINLIAEGLNGALE
ncbi:ABC transporter permease [Lichenifustis flavocetrariae]|uniref:ABC transporter permease n=1 Tax=Lichenifustis flavocetrariae TaxID=2949735 RepID=A0AA41Z2A5_9HYPH|nr:ABC transporter permease [Lichenifustis flavocetrariae]MCW6511681.1 ABC transporter permease [Lichenifustis flavocetrariae]